MAGPGTDHTVLRSLGGSGNPDNPFRQLGMSRSLDAFCCSRWSNNMIFMTTQKNTPLKSNSSLTQNDAMFAFGNTFSKAHHFFRYQFVRFPGSNRSKKNDYRGISLVSFRVRMDFLTAKWFDFNPRLLSCYMFQVLVAENNGITIGFFSINSCQVRLWTIPTPER